MRQIMNKETTLAQMVQEMEKNNASEITRIMFLPKTHAVAVEYR